MVFARRQRREHRLGRCRQEVAPVVSLGSQRPSVVGWCVCVGSGAHRSAQPHVRTRCCHDVARCRVLRARPVALVVYAGNVAHQYHVLYVLLAVGPVFVEHARCARHGEQIGVSRQRVFAYRILRSIATLLRVVVLDERHGVALVHHVGSQSAVCQLRPVAVVRSVAHRVAYREVERCRHHLAVHFRSVQPVGDIRLVAVEVFADGVGRVCRLVVHAREFAGIALCHVVAHTCVS